MNPLTDLFQWQRAYFCCCQILVGHPISKDDWCCMPSLIMKDDWVLGRNEGHGLGFIPFWHYIWWWTKALQKGSFKSFGDRQGNPLSPYPFVIVIEVLSHWPKPRNVGWLLYIELRIRISLTHLHFDNDTFFFIWIRGEFKGDVVFWIAMGAENKL